MNFDNKLIVDLVSEIRKEQLINPNIPNENFERYVKEGIYNINNSVGVSINFDEDMDARVLLKNYVLYANYKRLAEFKELYMIDYVALQIKYNNDSEL